ncbi:VOC family protein [Vallicoccus soli]|uniref:Glyoxalase n=1 Tax=Vallicoccus soli TaxID=2339232 RepID=A0A3A3YS96_9ACTN|nr:VOC family protein [Vallicoccus soli]RJK94280.1 glyoxalase [Vallicoccus soli]
MPAGARGIDHVGLTVPDLDAATRFFVEAFGAEVIYDTEMRGRGPVSGPGVEARLGVPPGTVQVAIRMVRLPDGPGIELFEYVVDGQRPPARACDVGLQHLALYVDDLDAALLDLVLAGGEPLSEPHPLPGWESGEGNRFVYCRAPWGSLIELITWPSPAPYELMTPLRRWVPRPLGAPQDEAVAAGDGEAGA